MNSTPSEEYRAITKPDYNDRLVCDELAEQLLTCYTGNQEDLHPLNKGYTEIELADMHMADTHSPWNAGFPPATIYSEMQYFADLMNKKYLWEILVPTEWHDADEKGVVNWESDLKPIRTRHHRMWDTQVIKITGGLTIIGKVGGKWVSKEGRKYEENMLAVRILCTPGEIRKIAAFTKTHYRQKAVMYSKISSESYIYEGEQENGLDESQVVS